MPSDGCTRGVSWDALVLNSIANYYPTWDPGVRSIENSCQGNFQATMESRRVVKAGKAAFPQRSSILLALPTQAARVPKAKMGFQEGAEEPLWTTTGSLSCCYFVEKNKILEKDTKDRCGLFAVRFFF